jgi:AcrR family transcriptional regulator
VPRVDARRNIDALLVAAKEEFAANGVDVNVRAIAARAGVGTATLYRHFPLRSDLLSAVFRREIDACAAEAPALARDHDPAEALTRWLHRFTGFVTTKRGLAKALHSGDPAFSALPAYFREHLGPAAQLLLTNAEEAGEIRGGTDPAELLSAVANLSNVPAGSADDERAYRMVDLLIDGLRYGARA